MDMMELSRYKARAIRHANEYSTICIELQRLSTGQILFRIEKRAHSFRKSSCNEYGKQFYRGERSRDCKSGGTGLGHAICKHILELHGSAYGVENTKDGVVFYFSLNESEGDNIEHC